MPWIKRLLFVSALLASQTAFSAEWGEGWDPVDPPVPTNVEKGKVEVLEFFWYGCPHCYTLEPHMDEWKKRKPENVELRLVPAPLNPGWTPHTQFFYAAEALGVVDKLHKPLFDAMHKEKRKIYDKNALIDFAAEQGVDKKAFTDAWNSFGVFVKVQQAKKLGNRYHLSGVPAVAINGKYKTSASLAGNYQNMIKIIDELIQAESAPATAAQ
jgi:thiol:disulfide interchange protein DsbA